MRSSRIVLSGVVAGLATSALSLVGGCPDTVLTNLTKERTGNISIQFINNTRYRAAFSYGTWDSWDRSPGPVTLQQLRLPPHAISSVAQLPCRRNAAIGTQEFVQRVLDTKADQTGTFDADAFDDTVHFSSAPSDSDLAALPTAGWAEGVEKLLGVDYSCGDLLIFTFWEDPDAPGGFRIDNEVILDKVQD